MERLGSEALIGHFSLKFLQDKSYAQLQEGMVQKNAEKAFRAAHTLKGVCANLGFTSLYQVSSALTEQLRGKEEIRDCEELYKAVTEQYERTISALETLQAEAQTAFYRKGYQPMTTTEFTTDQLKEIEEGRKAGIDVSVYENPGYLAIQMQEIRLGLEENLPVKQYTCFMYTAKTMHEKRLELLEKQKKAGNNPEQLKKPYSAFELFIAENLMEASVFLLDREKKVNREELLEALQQNNVRKGIDFQTMDQICEGKSDRDIVVIARGKEPTAGEDGWYEFFFETDLKKNPILLEDGSVDYQNAKWFEMVKAGQKVAYYHVAEPGRPGYKINGEEIPARRGREQRYLTGEGFRLMPDRRTYLVAIDGKIELKGGKVEISGRKGILVGGEVSAGTEILAYQIGNEMGLATKLCLRTRDDVLKDEAVILQEEEKNRHELVLLQNAYQDFRRKHPEEVRNVNPVYLKLEDAIYTKKLEQKMIADKKKELEKRKKKTKNHRIVAMGTMYSGVDVDINGLNWHSQELRNVVLREGDGYVRVEQLIPDK